MERTVQVCQLEKLRGHRAPAFWAAASPSSRLPCTYRALATTEQVLGLPLTGRAPCASTARRGPGARQPESSGRCLSRGLGQLLSLAERIEDQPHGVTVGTHGVLPGCPAPVGGLLQGLRLCKVGFFLLPVVTPLPYPSLSLWPCAGLFSHLKRRCEIPSRVPVLDEGRAEIPGVSSGAPGSFRGLRWGCWVGAHSFSKYTGSHSSCRRFFRH